MHQIILTPEQLENFHSDEFRANFRASNAALYSESETVSVVDEDGQLWDTFTGSNPDDRAVPLQLTDEQIAARNAQTEADSIAAERLESVIKPQVMAKLRAAARLEVREQIREKTNEVLRLRTEVSALERQLKQALSRRRTSDTEPPPTPRDASAEAKP